jgi:hypothetical protein
MAASAAPAPTTAPGGSMPKAKRMGPRSRVPPNGGTERETPRRRGAALMPSIPRRSGSHATIADRAHHIRTTQCGISPVVIKAFTDRGMTRWTAHDHEVCSRRASRTVTRAGDRAAMSATGASGSALWISEHSEFSARWFVRRDVIALMADAAQVGRWLPVSQAQVSCPMTCHPVLSRRRAHGEAVTHRSDSHMRTISGRNTSGAVGGG